MLDKSQGHLLSFAPNPIADRIWNTLSVNQLNRFHLTSEAESCQPKQNNPTMPQNAVIDQIQDLPNISIEICGSWIWVSGDTKPSKDVLNAACLWYAPKKQQWYWKPAGKRTRSRGIAMPLIREKYGSQHISGERDDD